MVGFVKTFDQYHHKFNFAHFFRIWNLDQNIIMVLLIMAIYTVP